MAVAEGRKRLVGGTYDIASVGRHCPLVVSRQLSDAAGTTLGPAVGGCADSRQPRYRLSPSVDVVPVPAEASRPHPQPVPDRAEASHATKRAL